MPRTMPPAPPMADALNHGYSPEEIHTAMSQKMQEAQAAGYSTLEAQTAIDEYLKQPNPFNANAVAAPGHAVLSSRPAPTTLGDAIATGWNWGAMGLGREMLKDKSAGRLPAQALSNEMPWALQAAGTLAGLASDAPAFVAGAFLGGGPLSPVTAAAGGFGLAAGLRQTFVDALVQNEIGTKKEFADRAAGTIIETAKGWVVGATTASVGALASRSTSALPGAWSPVLATTAELATLTEVSARIEGHAPEPRDLLNTAIVLGVVKAVMPSWSQATPITDIYTKTGIMPEQLMTDAMHGEKGVWQDVLDGRMPDAYKGHVETPPRPQTQAQRIDEVLTRAGASMKPTSGDPFFSAAENTVYISDIPDAEFVSKYGATKDDVILHEAGHALLNSWDMTGEIKGPDYADLRAELRMARVDFKAGAKILDDITGAKRAHFNKSQELLADGLAVWMKHPEKRAEMPLFTKLFGSRLDQITKAMDTAQADTTIAPKETAAPPKEKIVSTLTPEQQAQARAFMEQPFAEIPQAPGEPSRPTHMNYNYIQTTEEVSGALSRLSTIYEDQIKTQQRSPRGWAKSHEDAASVLADLVHADEKTVTAFLKGQTPGPSTTAQLLARKELAVGFMEDLMRSRASLLAKGDAATPEDLATFLGQVEKVSQVQAGFLGQRADVGRALNSLKSTKREADRAQALIDVVNGYGGPESIRELVKKLGEYDSPAQVAAFATAATKATTREMLVEAWKAGLVSGLRTHEVNILSTLAFTTLKLPTDALAAVIGQNRPVGERIEYAEIPARALGLLAGIREGMTVAGAVLRTGEAPGPKTDTFKQAIPGTLGEIVRLPFRALSAADAMLRTMNERGELYAQATRQTLLEQIPMRDPRFMARVVSLVDHPTPAMQEAARIEGDRRIFTTPLGPGGQAFQRTVREWGLEWIFPFLTTPGNIFKETARMTPGANFLVREWRADYEAGGIRRDRAMAETLLGAALMTAVVAAASDGLITGGGQPDKRLRSTDKAAGWKPYAIKMDGQYYDGYLRMAPIGPVMGAAVDMHEFWNYMTSEEHDQWARMLAFAFANVATNQSSMTGLTNLVNVLQDPSRYGENYFESLAGSLVPSIIGQTAADRDPLMREIHGMQEAMRARIPLMREGLMPQKDLFGQPIASPERLWVGSPFTVSSAATDKVRLEASRIGFATPTIPKTLDTIPNAKLGTLDLVRLTPEQRDGFATQSGQLAYRILQPLVDQPNWDTYPKLVKRMMFEQTFKASRDYAHAQLVAGQDPAVTQAAIGELQRRLAYEK